MEILLKEPVEEQLQVPVKPVEEQLRLEYSSPPFLHGKQRLLCLSQQPLNLGLCHVGKNRPAVAVGETSAFVFAFDPDVAKFVSGFVPDFTVVCADAAFVTA